jgi:hypothetical protein
LSKSNEKKTLQLGMSVGTATHRLRKQIMMMLVAKCSLDLCYRCGNKICNPEDLSVEHKQPWLDVSPALFWNIDNIAFSHLSCNVSAARKHKVTAEHKRRKKAERMRKYYNSEKRRQRFLTTGW